MRQHGEERCRSEGLEVAVRPLLTLIFFQDLGTTSIATGRMVAL